ncbi:MAG: DEAD/DEAH box helicase family protein, partial [Muribaculaceae bacterium]|nr:DEAD/DEAH box helicase family protein [Muribaculaceae bacterium]
PAKDKSIEVQSNVGMGKFLSEDGDIVVRREADKDYRVITVKPRQAVVIKKLLELKKFPADAQEQVKSMLTRLDQMIDVHSPLLDSKSIPTVKGSPTLCARIRPASGMTYVVSILAHPAPSGKEFYLPGEGKPVVYDMVDGKTVKVKRDISGELASLERMQEEMPFLDDDNNVDSGFVFSLLVDDVLSLIDFAKAFPGDLVIDWEEGKALSVNRATPSSWNVGLKSSNDWFEVEGEVRVNDHMVVTMTELLEKIQQSRGRFVRLNETDYLEISGKLRKQLERIDALAVKQRNKTVISTFNAALLDDKALDGELKVAFDERLVKLRKKITESYDYSPKVPSALNAQLRPYQLEGFQWLARLSCWGAGACLADDMGLGKTVQTIAFLLLKASEGPALVVAPASVVPNWVGEINKFAPTLNVFILNKSTDRSQLIKDAGAYDVVLSTYGILSSEETSLSDKKWGTVCLDEAHVIKNKDTKMSQAVMMLNAECRIILTGTPIQNHLGELWNLFRFINPGLLGSDASFRRKFVIPIQEHDK